MNRINQKLQEDKKLLSIYFTAGYPNIDDTVTVIQALEKSGVDMIEIGLPFSDPLADGPTIQASSTKALHNGMTSELLFEQLKDIRKSVSIPLIIMGYFNPILQFGVEAFCEKCAEIGIDGLIIPDLPVDVYNEQYKATLLPRLYKESGPDPFELPPEAVVKKLIHAIEARNPRPRYFVTTPTYLMATLRRLLPTWALDWVLSRP